MMDLVLLGISDLRKMSYDQHQKFLEDWRDYVPAELVSVYLQIVGRDNDDLKDYRMEWTADGTLSVEVEIDYGYSSIVLIEQVRGNSAEALAMSGKRIMVPVARGDGGSIVWGNSHKHRRFKAEEGYSRTRIVEMQVLPRGDGSPELIFRRFVEAVARECFRQMGGEHWFEAMSALGSALDRATCADQTTVRDTERLLRDRLPTVLAALKLPEDSQALSALRKYEAEEIGVITTGGDARDQAKRIDDLKEDLWTSVKDDPATLVGAVRSRIRDQGYSSNRVLFELYQNADDAYLRDDYHSKRVDCFSVDFDAGQLRIVHWGRRINYLGSNPDQGRRLGYGQDLLNMLVMSFSEKRLEAAATGKFGLGFKCVHLLSDSVGIASGFVALRTVGGLLPVSWRDGLSQARDLSDSGRGKATVIEVPYTTEEMARDGASAVQAFEEAMAWLPIFSKKIRRIIFGQRKIECCVSRLEEDDSIEAVTVREDDNPTYQALRFSLGGDYSLLLRIGAHGPACFDASIRRIWNLAPLEEEIKCGWLLNGPFQVDPGRGRLSGSPEDRQSTFKSLGSDLGHRLLALHDLVERDWVGVARVLGLREGSDGRRRFWSGLFDVLSRDLGDNLAGCMHTVDRGLGRLIAEKPVAPTRLPLPFDTLVCASSARWFTSKALDDSVILEKTREWSSEDMPRSGIVAREVAAPLGELGFHVAPITVSSLLAMKIGEDGYRRVGPGLAIQLGKVITPESIEKEPLLQERDDILRIARHAEYRAQDGRWRHVRYLSVRGRDAEAAFAPMGALLHEEYGTDSLEFFMVSRRESGYGSVLRSALYGWVSDAADERRQRAVLKYLVDGRQGPYLGSLLRINRPAWMDLVSTRGSSHPLFCDGDWSVGDVTKVLAEIDPKRVVVTRRRGVILPNRTQAKSILDRLYRWWMCGRVVRSEEYSSSVYPGEFIETELFGALESADNPAYRGAWFTLLALACYQSFGRTQDEQHRNFIARGLLDKWWTELAESRFPDPIEPWIDRLKQWSDPDRTDEAFHQWEKTLVDLCTISRGLEIYAELMWKFPKYVDDLASPSLDAILNPRQSELAQKLGLYARPIGRVLGIGINWVIRELSRNGVYSEPDVKSIVPYCWAPKRRVRVFLSALDRDKFRYLAANRDHSRYIHEYISGLIGEERACFGGDLDLPLQIVTRSENHDLLNRWFDDADIDRPDFRYEAEDHTD